jgi:glutaredoxin
MKTLFFSFLLVVSSTLISQVREVEIVSIENKDGIDLYAKNNTRDTIEATVNVDIRGFKRTKGNNPATIKLAPGAEVFFSSLTIPAGVECEYQTSVSFKKSGPKIVREGGESMEKRFTSIQMNPVKVNVFTQDGCGRCAFLIKYLEDHKIPYTELNTSIHIPNQDLMFEQLEKAGFKNNTVTMPVVVHNGKTYYDIKDLQKFAGRLK